MSTEQPHPLAQEFVTLPVAAEFLGIGRRTAYDLAQRDEFPVPVRRIGRSVRVARRALEQYLADSIPS